MLNSPIIARSTRGRPVKEKVKDVSFPVVKKKLCGTSVECSKKNLCRNPV
jgi:hypothetical protein